MKKQILIANLLFVSFLAGAQVKVNSTGLVGIGLGVSNPAYKLDVNGDINAAQGNAYRLGGSKIVWCSGTNFAVGIGAGANATGNMNTCVGGSAGAALTTGSYNTFIGNNAGATFTTAWRCTAVGSGALSSSTGNDNTAVGLSAGISNVTGIKNTYIGTFADATNPDLINATAIGYGALATASNMVKLGNGGVTYVGSSGQNFITSDGRFKFNVKEEVSGLEFINKLRPVTYQMDTKKLDDYNRKGMRQEGGDGTSSKMGNNTINYAASTSIIRSGFIAQEVEQAVIATGFKTDIVHAPENENDNYSLAYGEFVVPLVKAVQELSAKVNSQQKEIDKLNSIGSATTTPTVAQTSIHELELANNTVLFQNFPNPFGDGTTIKYFIPDNIQNAQIVFFDEFGNKLKEMKVDEKGMGQLNIASANLSTGVYSYSLIVNDKVVDTKKMIRVK